MVLTICSAFKVLYVVMSHSSITTDRHNTVQFIKSSVVYTTRFNLMSNRHRCNVYVFVLQCYECAPLPSGYVWREFSLFILSFQWTMCSLYINGHKFCVFWLVDNNFCILCIIYCCIGCRIFVMFLYTVGWTLLYVQYVLCFFPDIVTKTVYSYTGDVW